MVESRDLILNIARMSKVWVQVFFGGAFKPLTFLTEVQSILKHAKKALNGFMKPKTI